MRSRSGKKPDLAAQEAFIAGAAADEKEKGVTSLDEDDSKPNPEPKPQNVYDLVQRTAWPITFTKHQPILAPGRNDIDRPFVMRLKEDLWNSVEAHCTALGVSKSEWVREAILRQLWEEQQYFLQGK